MVPNDTTTTKPSLFFLRRELIIKVLDNANCHDCHFASRSYEGLTELDLVQLLEALVQAEHIDAVSEIMQEAGNLKLGWEGKQA